MTRKVLFLDHDGVMVLRDTDNELNDWFDRKCVEILNEIILQTKCEIVVSSDWRLHYDLKALGDIYSEAGIIKRPCSVTEDLFESGMNLKDLENLRVREIKWWLFKHRIDKFCVVDDMSLKIDNFVQTDNGITGISGIGIKEKILKNLN